MDRFADISSLLAEYATSYDSGDWASVGRCFTEDAVFERVGDAGAPTIIHRGRDEIGSFMRTSLDGQRDVRRHFTTNIRILSHDERSAQITSYLLLGAVEEGELRIVQSGQYRDVIVWGPDGARFAHRRLTMDGHL